MLPPAAGRPGGRLQARVGGRATASRFNHLLALANMPIQRFGSHAALQGAIHSRTWTCSRPRTGTRTWKR
ncbi:MAG: hypothetical protein MZW92_81365 [Comamonadaceae bacterium]|nr:hypothetical protein [Comamonadaceae bacterium]